MRLFSALMFVVLSLSMAGCKLQQVKGEVGGVEVEAQTQDNKKDKDSEFCPPGQAKKGKC
ncbi:hypothetical protein [Litoribrevibacter albus]|uniref:Uncharacterized protein n=1 Tax=Litoribrevibacter albus TaxID=1473156 RepID=A0AA37SD76_9GAMM|nr:hypothetical protein [Litoribrevibacter albus]GLQ33354.1 hypothetical protein GCM10007876_38340 [Litoribrevibacter albus]